MKNFFYLVGLSATLIFTGCGIMKYETSPEMVGQVIADHTNEPIKGATVVVMWEKTTYTSTDQKGYFNIPATYKWEPFLFLPGDKFPENHLLIQKEGFYSEVADYTEYKKGPIILTKKPNKTLQRTPSVPRPDYT